MSWLDSILSYLSPRKDFEKAYDSYDEEQEESVLDKYIRRAKDVYLPAALGTAEEMLQVPQEAQARLQGASARNLFGIPHEGPLRAEEVVPSALFPTEEEGETLPSKLLKASPGGSLLESPQVNAVARGASRPLAALATDPTLAASMGGRIPSALIGGYFGVKGASAAGEELGAGLSELEGGDLPTALEHLGGGAANLGVASLGVKGAVHGLRGEGGSVRRVGGELLPDAPIDVPVPEERSNAIIRTGKVKPEEKHFANIIKSAVENTEGYKDAENSISAASQLISDIVRNEIIPESQASSFAGTEFETGALGSRGNKTGDITINLAALALKSADRGTFADGIIDTLSHEFGHAGRPHAKDIGGIKAGVDPEGVIQKGVDPYIVDQSTGKVAEVPPTEAWEYEERAKFSPDEAAFNNAMDAVKHNPKVAETLFRLREQLANSPLYDNLRKLHRESLPKVDNSNNPSGWKGVEEVSRAEEIPVENVNEEIDVPLEGLEEDNVPIEGEDNSPFTPVDDPNRSSMPLFFHAGKELVTEPKLGPGIHVYENRPTPKFADLNNFESTAVFDRTDPIKAPFVDDPGSHWNAPELLRDKGIFSVNEVAMIRKKKADGEYPPGYEDFATSKLPKYSESDTATWSGDEGSSISQYGQNYDLEHAWTSYLLKQKGYDPALAYKNFYEVPGGTGHVEAARWKGRNLAAKRLGKEVHEIKDKDVLPEEYEAGGGGISHFVLDPRILGKGKQLPVEMIEKARRGGTRLSDNVLPREISNAKPGAPVDELLGEMKVEGVGQPSDKYKKPTNYPGGHAQELNDLNKPFHGDPSDYLKSHEPYKPNISLEKVTQYMDNAVENFEFIHGQKPSPKELSSMHDQITRTGFGLSINDVTNLKKKVPPEGSKFEVFDAGTGKTLKIFDNEIDAEQFSKSIPGSDYDIATDQAVGAYSGAAERSKGKSEEDYYKQAQEGGKLDEYDLSETPKDDSKTNFTNNLTESLKSSGITKEIAKRADQLIKEEGFDWKKAVRIAKAEAAEGLLPESISNALVSPLEASKSESGIPVPPKKSSNQGELPVSTAEITEKELLATGLMTPEELQVPGLKHVPSLDNIDATTPITTEQLDRGKRNVGRPSKASKETIPPGDSGQPPKPPKPPKESKGEGEGEVPKVPKSREEAITDADSFFEGWRKLRTTSDKIRELFNIHRALRSSGDTPVLRQGRIISFNNPVIAFKAAKEMAKSVISKEHYDTLNSEIAKDPTVTKFAAEGSEYVPDFAGITGLREESFPSPLAEKIPVAGKYLIAPSDRAYTSFMNSAKLGYWKKHIKNLEKSGMTLESNPKDFKDLARVTNMITFRGDTNNTIVKELAHSPTAGAMFYSPRNKASQVQLMRHLLLPSDLTSYNSKLLRKNLTQTFAINAAIYGGLAYAGIGTMESDPESSDFLKLKVGERRYNPWMGMNQIVRAAVLASTGRTKSLAGKQYRTTPEEVFGRFVRSSLAPTPGMMLTLFTGTNPAGTKARDSADNIEKQIFDTAIYMFTNEIGPLNAKDIVDEWRASGAASAIATVAIPGAMGENVAVYEPREEKPKGTKKKKPGKKYKYAY